MKLLWFPLRSKFSLLSTTNFRDSITLIGPYSREIEIISSLWRNWFGISTYVFRLLMQFNLQFHSNLHVSRAKLMLNCYDVRSSFLFEGSKQIKVYLIVEKIILKSIDCSIVFQKLLKRFTDSQKSRLNTKIYGKFKRVTKKVFGPSMFQTYWLDSGLVNKIFVNRLRLLHQ